MQVPLQNENDPGLLTQKPARALTAKSLFMGLFLLLMWTLLIGWSVPDEAIRGQQLILLGGFGAIFTLFLLKLISDFFPFKRRPTPAEYTFVFAMLIVGIPSACLGRIALESAIGNHVFNRVEAGEKGLVPDFWAPNPHIGYVPLLDTLDARCPYVELPPQRRRFSQAQSS
ncbi:hypothetical protein ACFL6F_02340 [Planctomycetota bacterium]